MPSSMGSACHSRPNSCSEISNVVSACSGHDSLSENEESKENKRASYISEQAEKFRKVNTNVKILGDHSLPKGALYGDKTYLSQHQKQRALEYSGDNISSISTLECVGNLASDLNGCNDKKSLSSGSASDYTTCAIEKSVGDQSAFCCLDRGYDAAGGNKNCGSSVKLTHKSEISEISSLKDSCNGVSFSKGELSEHLEEQVESSLTRPAVVVVDDLDDMKNRVKIHTPDTKMTSKNSTKEAAKCSDETENLGNIVRADEHSSQVPPLQSPPTVCADGGQNLVDVRVCDICGDVGWERQLIACSKCNDGAEHIYCMRVKLDKVPVEDWMCELCMLEDQKERHVQQEDENKKKVTPSSLGMIGVSCSLNGNKRLESDVKSSDAKRIENIDKPHFHAKKSKDATAPAQDTSYNPAKRPLDPAPPAHSKRRSLETQRSFSCMFKARNEDEKCQLSELENSDNRRAKSSIKGGLFKSKSFNVTRVDSKIQLPKGVLEQNYAGKMAGSGKINSVRGLLSKSASFNNTTSGDVNITESKSRKLYSSISNGDNYGKLKQDNGTKVQGKESIPKLNSLKMLVAPSPVLDKQIPGRNNCCEKSSRTSKSAMSPTNRGLKADDNGLPCDARNDVKCSVEAAIHVKRHNVTATGSSIEQVGALSSEVPFPTSVVLQPGHIWRGGLKIQRSGRPLAVCSGFQAHLATHVSPKVVEAVQKLPRKIFLEQVPRSDIWPAKFLENQPTEDSIALYFFAGDSESYKSNYKSLLESMIKNDLGLKGNVDGIELLIFTSVQLPDKSQRWNKLLYLWGVFRGKKLTDSDDVSPKNSALSEQAQSIISLQKPSHAHEGNAKTFDSKESSRQDSKDSERSNEQLKVVEDFENAGVGKKMSNNDSSEGGERDSKRGMDIDLNRTCNDDNGNEFYEQKECKRLKCSMENFDSGSSGGSAFTCNRFVFGMKLQSDGLSVRPGIEINDAPCTNSYPVDGPPMTKFTHGHLAFTEDANMLESGSRCTKYGAISGIRVQPSLELSLAAGENLLRGEVLPLLFGMSCASEDHGFPNAPHNVKECSTSLSLSLALPFEAKERALTPWSGKKQCSPWRGVDSSLSLYGGGGLRNL